MPEPLDYAELEKVAKELLPHLELNRGQIVKAFRAIATRALEQAARLPPKNPDDPDRRVHIDDLLVGDPPVRLRDALAALKKPKDSATA